MEYNSLFSSRYSTNNKNKNDKAKEYNIEYKIFERRKRSIQIEKKYLQNIKIDNNFVEKALNKINEYRKLHGVNSLSTDDYLVKRAFLLAQKKLTDFIGEDFLYKNGEDLGINLEKCENELDVGKLMDNWYNESKNYNYIEPIELECNNFTQMIWKSSQKFGIGYYCSQDKNEEENPQNNKYYYVALFYPAGNIPGEYKSNIPKKQVEKNNLKSSININKKEIQIKKEIVSKNKEEIGKEVIKQYKMNMTKVIKFFILLILVAYNLRKLYIENKQLDN